MAQTYTLFFGVGSAGGTPTWTTFVDDATGSPLSQPSFTDVGGGFYQFSVDWGSTAASSIRYVASLAGYLDQWDVITSSPQPGTVTPSIRVQNIALFPTAATVINRTAKQVGVISADLSDPYASSDASIVLMRELLVSLADDLVQKFNWTNLVQEVTFVTDGVSTSYTLPSDFKEMIDETFWNRDARLPGVGPLSFQQTAALKARLVSIVINVTFQLNGGMMTFPIVPPSGAHCAFNYLSKNWVQSNGSGTPDKDRPSASNDRLLFDEELLIAGLKFYWLNEKGFDATRAEERFNEKVEAAIGRAAGAPVLSMGPRGPTSFNRMIDGHNVPEGAWPT